MSIFRNVQFDDTNHVVS